MFGAGCWIADIEGGMRIQFCSVLVYMNPQQAGARANPKILNP